jgi:hypothetical protein
MNSTLNRDPESRLPLTLEVIAFAVLCNIAFIPALCRALLAH